MLEIISHKGEIIRNSYRPTDGIHIATLTANRTSFKIYLNYANDRHLSHLGMKLETKPAFSINSLPEIEIFPSHGHMRPLSFSLHHYNFWEIDKWFRKYDVNINTENVLGDLLKNFSNL